MSRFALAKIDITALKALSYIISLTSQFDVYHSWRVAYFCKIISARICKKSEFLCFVSGLVHDIAHCKTESKNCTDRSVCYTEKEDVDSFHKSACLIIRLPGFSDVAKVVFEYAFARNGFIKNSREAQVLGIADDLALFWDKPYNEMMSYIKSDMKGYDKNLVLQILDIFEDKKFWDVFTDDQALIHEVENYYCDVKEEPGFPLFTNALLSFFGMILDHIHCYEEDHSQRVSAYCSLIGIALGLQESEISNLKCAAFIHDIAKIGLPKHIFCETKLLSMKDSHIVTNHAEISYDKLKRIPSFKVMAEYFDVDSYHWDGTGYSNDLQIEQQTLQSRIIAVADAFDSMITNAHYRDVYTVDEAFSELYKNAGIQFDPVIVKRFCSIFEGLSSKNIITGYSLQGGYK